MLQRKPPGEFARHRMFTAVVEVLGALARVRPMALLLEDLHWADMPTLDLVEHALSGRLSLPMVGTWRLDDPDVSSTHHAWEARIRRNRAVTSMVLPPSRGRKRPVSCGSRYGQRTVRGRRRPHPGAGTGTSAVHRPAGRRP